MASSERRTYLEWATSSRSLFPSKSDALPIDMALLQYYTQAAITLAFLTEYGGHQPVFVPCTRRFDQTYADWVLSLESHYCGILDDFAFEIGGIAPDIIGY